MAGVAWFVALVAYPLFARVGAGEWTAYHALHSARTTWVVLPPMAVELVTSLWLPFRRLDGVGPAPLALGAVLAAGTWVLTALAARVHGRLAAPLDAAEHRRLTVLHALRTALWTAHAVILVTLTAVSAG